MTAFMQSGLDGLLMGGVYALAALGISLLFGVMKITNFAHGALLTLGMYITFQIYSLTGALPYIAMVPAVLIMFAIGYLIQRGLLAHIMSAPSHNQLVLTLGLQLIVQNLILMIWGSDYKRVSVASFDTAWRIGPLAVNKPRLIAFIFAFAITLLLYFIMERTDLGKSIRATSMEQDGAELMGIRKNRINAIAFGIGVACAGAAGALLTPIQYISPSLGGNYLLKCFVIAVFGGLGNIWGAVMSGVIIGVVESAAALLLGGSWSEVVIYSIFVLTLLFRPSGLFGKTC